MDEIAVLEKKLFLLINQKWTNPFLDIVFPWMRDAENWYPFYLILLIFVIIKFKKKSWLWLLIVAITIFITDQLSSTIIKPIFQRIRPCNDPNFKYYVRVLLQSPPGWDSWSFPSSHATNHLGIACFAFISLYRFLKNWSYLFIIWGLLIGYAQIYVGLHYPLDFLVGSLLGAFIGVVAGKAFEYYLKKI